MRFLAAIVLGSVMAASSWADTIKITVVHEAAGSAAAPAGSAAYVVEAGQSRVFDGMRTMRFEPTSGDCTRVDTSKLERQARDGETLQVTTTHLVDDHAFVRLEYEHRKFLGTTEHAYNQRCKVNNPSSDITAFSQTVALRKGAPALLLRSSPGFKVFGVIEP
ncbi:MAG: hypothetical protein H0W47_12410 [Polaromonas sp.]|uniref:hypothetical protein n=1 Tax=Polaromonas sp. TaxID=1869339 RepID=UPI00181C0E6D|nr:hypothetical protein [Polaromonas sp.]MBA3594582.1 hypothetical protein [Polaromonas sp.]